MNVRDLMTSDVVSLEAKEKLDLAHDIMRLGRIRHMPVLEDGKLVGILSQRDLFRAAVSSVLQFRPAVEREWLAGIAVREVMTTNVVSIAPTAPIHQAVQLMIDKKFGCIPVVEDGRLVGLLGESDCLRYLARLLDIAETRQELPDMQE